MKILVAWLGLFCQVAFADAFTHGGLGVYGNGSDGTNTAVCCGSLTADCTLTRDVFCSSVTTGVHNLNTANFVLRANQKVTVSTGGVIRNNGTSGTNSATPPVTTPDGTLIGGGQGGAGCTTSGAGAVGLISDLNSDTAYPPFSLSVSTSGGSTFVPTTSGTPNVVPPAGYGNFNALPAAASGVLLGGAFWTDLSSNIVLCGQGFQSHCWTYTPILGGGAGGAGAACNAGVGGAGGNGGGPMILAAPVISCSGSIEARGGDGGHVTTGGGGGAGGNIITISGSFSGCTPNVSGGAGGVAGANTGQAGGSGKWLSLVN